MPRMVNVGLQVSAWGKARQVGREGGGDPPEIFPFLLSESTRVSRAVPAQGLIPAMPSKGLGTEQGEGIGHPSVHSMGCWIVYQGPITTELYFSPDSHCWAGFDWTLVRLCILLGRWRSLSELPVGKLRSAQSPTALWFGQHRGDLCAHGN